MKLKKSELKRLIREVLLEAPTPIKKYSDLRAAKRAIKSAPGGEKSVVLKSNKDASDHFLRSMYNNFLRNTAGADDMRLDPMYKSDVRDAQKI